VKGLLQLALAKLSDMDKYEFAECMEYNESNLEKGELGQFIEMGQLSLVRAQPEAK